MKALSLLLVLLATSLGGAGLPADLVAEQARLQAQLTARAAGFGFADVADLRKFDAAPDVALALSRQQLLRKVGAPALQAFRQEASPAAFLAWLWEDATALNLFLEAATPLGLNQRDEDKWSVKTETLARWARLWQADPDSRRGLPLRLAMATALLPPGEGNHGAGQQVPPPDPLGRYLHFKQAYLAKELYPSFERHSVWEYMQVVSSPASDADLAWTRRMVNTWRPDLRAKEMVVKTVSEVKYGNSPHPYGDYKDVLDGGGKCGPRSSWGVMVCQAFGLPAVGVAQPGHACVAFKTAFPETQPQPGNIWKVDYGAGWEKSRINGLSGPDFLQAVAARSRAAEFTQVERTRWLGAAVAPAAPAQVALKTLLSSPRWPRCVGPSRSSARAITRPRPRRNHRPRPRLRWWPSRRRSWSARVRRPSRRRVLANSAGLGRMRVSTAVGRSISRRTPRIRGPSFRWRSPVPVST